MDRYQKVEKPKVETPIDENEIRITSQGRMRSYITYAMSLLQVFLYIALSFRVHSLVFGFSFPSLGLVFLASPIYLIVLECGLNDEKVPRILN